MAAATPPVPAPAPASPAPLTDEVRDVGAALRDKVRSRAYTAIGAIKVLGTVEVVAGDVQGSVSVGGRLTADRFRSDGVLDLGADAQVKGEAALKGSTRISGGLTAGDLRASGALEVNGALTVDAQAVVHGDLSVTGTISARSLEFEGTIQAPGDLDCPMIQGRLRGPSRVGAIHAQHVRIVRAAFPHGHRGELVADRIEATEVEIEAVSVEYLRAERVTLGAHCQVTRLDGEVIRRHRTAVVGPVAYEKPPPGLSR